ncbi:glycosyltransferase, exosortase A system-associated [Pseudothauera nasutitermitis]|uniref:Glycosyltransferase, exosortase A system-associated n=1 Tax=Pseudothauera nasutitermitis TaxID=2565930 RepID=A0A4S4AUL7_9RHOO|nr:TIGR04063 family PEP-CTERM/XrtA system glycosyltransferase [Pseudothauera nasutitermitis]THF63657.1 glycosyltransferase, exosortase A system-associated [Pseudothauera nasutitermitis]
MRILHVLDHSIPLHSGYTFRSAALLREQRALGWQTFHLTSPKQGACAAEVDEVDGLLFHRTPVPPPAPPGFHEVRLMRALERRLEALAAELRPDILHAHSPVLNAIPALRVGRRLGIPVVYEIRAFWEDAAVDHGTARANGPRYRATRALESWALRRVDHVFTICEGLRGDILARGIPAERVTVIPNAVDVEDFQPAGVADPALRARLGLDGAIVLGFVGSFYAYEGLDLLMRALPALIAAHPTLRVLLVGGGPAEGRLRALAAELGVAGRVVFTGRVPHAEVGRYYDLIDLLVYPRHSMRLTELVTPLKPLEAMAQERVFVASDVGGHRELVRDGETGRLFAAGSPQALADAVGEMLARRAEWPAFGRAGRSFVEQARTWSRSVAAYRPAYAGVLGGPAA